MKWWQYPIYWAGKRSQRVRLAYHQRTGKFLWGISGLISDKDWRAMMKGKGGP